MRKILLAIPLSFLLLSTVATTARAPTIIKPIPSSLFRAVEIPPPIIYEKLSIKNRERPLIKQVVPEAKIELKSGSTEGFTTDPNVSWYGPGFYGNRTACGLVYTKTILGVAHKTLPCGTLVTFRYKDKEQTVPVIDRGPYVKGRQWDLSGGLCVVLEHCFTGKLEYKIEK